MDKKRLRQHVANIVRAYEESLEAVGEPTLEKGQREVLQAFLELIYEESRIRQTDQKTEVPEGD
jgi:hypothetical protein